LKPFYIAVIHRIRLIRLFTGSDPGVDGREGVTSKLSARVNTNGTSHVRLVVNCRRYENFKIFIHSCIT